MEVDGGTEHVNSECGIIGIKHTPPLHNLSDCWNKKQDLGCFAFLSESNIAI